MLKFLPHKSSKEQGFSLAEMSVVLVVIGFIAASAISVAINSDYTTKRNETEAKLDKIEAALAGFVSSNHRLPCPADGTLALNDANFGLELFSGSNPHVCTKNFNTGNAWSGVVPSRSLQLPDDFMMDGWGRRIDYIVDTRLTDNDVGNTACTGVAGNSCFRDLTAGTIQVQDQSGIAPHRTTTAAYVLVSHGENGHGAFPKPGSATGSRIIAINASSPFLNSTNEFLNSKFSSAGATTAFTAIFSMMDYVRDTVGGIIFDDQVRFKNKNLLVLSAGGLMYESVCKTAKNIAEGTATDCAGATDDTQCQTFAAEIISRCVQ